MSGVSYGGGAPKYNEDPDLTGVKGIARFIGFTYNKDGDLVVTEKLPFAYTIADDGQVWAKADPQKNVVRHVVPPQEVAKIRNDQIVYAKFQMLAPHEAKGVVVPCSVSVKGIYVWEDEAVGWQFYVKANLDPTRKNDRLSGLIEMAIQCGLDASLLDPTSPFYSQENEDGVKAGVAYVMPAIEKMEAPLDVLQVLEHLVEAKMIEARENGHLVELLVDPNNKGGKNWVKRASIRAVSVDRANQILEQIGDVALPGQDTKIDVGALKDAIRGAVASGQITKEDLFALAQEQGANPTPTGGPMLDQVVAQIGASGLARLKEAVVPDVGEEDLPPL